MSQPPPPPPPPHGNNPKTTAGGSGLPPGKYDIFIIPEHSAGSGFLYLPSLRPQWNSFIAGVASTLMAVVIGNSIAPAMKAWWAGFQGIGNAGLVLLMLAIGLGAWSLGKSQTEKEPFPPPPGSGHSPGGSQQRPPGGGFNQSGGYYTPPPNGAPPPNQGPPPPPPPQHEAPRNDRPNPGQSWQEAPRPEPRPQPPPPPPPQPEPRKHEAEPEPPKPQPQPQAQPKPQPKPQPTQAPPPRPSTTRAETPKGAWEKAREETRRREEERKVKEAEAKRREETARRLRELREREAKEREQREKETRERDTRERLRKEQEARDKERMEKEVREKVEKELREQVAKEAREAREKEAREKEEAKKREEERARLQAAREREAKERLERLERQRKEEEEKTNTRKGSSYAFSSVGEKTSMWPNGKPPATTSTPAGGGSPASTTRPAPSPSPTKPAPAKSTTGTEDTFSYRPYDKPKKPGARKKSVSDFSESSWAPSASTARTTPPPSMRGPYSTSDPQKIVIKAVYGFLNQFSKTPASQLISGVGTVTDGLILRITSAGLFVDDDVRGVAQREWDVKAWTLKLVEVWCPTHAVTSTPGSVPTNHPFFKAIPSSSHRRAAERGATKTFVGEEAFGYLEEFGRACKETCSHGPSASASSAGSSVNDEKTGEWRAKGLHLLRVTMRDQEGKRHLFVISEEESWKIAKGLQTLRSGSQVRALNVAGFSGLEAKGCLETLGWG